MEIDIKHCNNIDTAKISIGEGKLNIKFAPNGSGKSTIAKTIQFASVGDENELVALTPFKYRDINPEGFRPEVTGLEHINNIMCFNEEYVSQFTFKPEELVSNSFEIFIRTDAYKSVEGEIIEFIQTIQQEFTNNPDLESLLLNLKELSGAFKVTASGSLSKSSTGMKGLSLGNKLAHIPAGLESYQPFIQSSKSVNWVDWQAKGHKEFSELSESCPFCSTDSSGKRNRLPKLVRNTIKT